MEDIKKKAHCDNERRECNNQKELLEFDMDTLKKEMDSGEAKKTLLSKQIQHTTKSIQNLEAEMKEYLNTRNAQNDAFKTGLKADTDAVMLLAKAIETLSKYADSNKLALTQKAGKKHAKKHGMKRDDPEYTTSEDTAPAAEFSSASSGASETGGIVGIIENIKQDLEEEISKSKEQEGEALQAYHDTEKESTDSLTAMNAKIASMEVDIADTTSLVADKQETSDDKKRQHDAVDAYLASIAPECDWMDENFELRKEARESEIEGLDDAKAKLAGAGPALISAKSRVGKRSTTLDVDEELKQLDITEASMEGNFLQSRKVKMAKK
jgi:chromosome segregation ATPase